MSGLVLAESGISAPGIYLGLGSFLIQFGNLIVIVLMIILFVGALFLPFPRGKDRK
ncbi:hypothetical protein [Paenarthrobacter sp. PH39-S1]|uniref:hypothetical protein n=1 Tax=Paenarthrobacter sp. PH39-S1 TaxID=3046204 RepID=UPI0024BB9A1D|nr:hypothetical protein [Paenarthrobacter sp. PH39-S1]MDJ0355333.1 hypothetical protein [Paenarthrobacter sp. PH39-S1]